MSRTVRCHVSPPIPPDLERVTLGDAEAHHLIHVMRAQLGDEVTLFDGSGCEFPAAISALKRTTVELRLLGREAVDRETTYAITLAVALPKGDRQTWLIEKAVELGVQRLVPLITERGVAQPVDKALERLRRTVSEASKQCGRNRLLLIDGAQTVPQLCDAAAASDSLHRLQIVAHPTAHAATLYQVLAARFPPAAVGRPAAGGTNETIESTAGLPIATARLAECMLAVGPEGGFTDGEVGWFVEAGWDVVGFGKRILRVETAALAFVAGLIAWSGETT
jgi:16S rRNA (uracil1498-N3)-methyltransferase